MVSVTVIQRKLWPFSVQEGLGGCETVISITSRSLKFFPFLHLIILFAFKVVQNVHLRAR